MSKAISKKIYEARQVYEAVLPFKEQLSGFGINDSYLNQFKGLIEETEGLVNKYNIELGEEKELTNKQDELIVKISRTLQVLKNFARYIANDSEIISSFRTGKAIPTTVSNLLKEGKMIYEAANNYKNRLSQNGFDVNKVEELKNNLKSLEEIDTLQEQEKKELKNITELRNKKLDELYRKYRYVQKTANTVFADSENIKRKFFDFLPQRSTKQEAEETAK